MHRRHGPHSPRRTPVTHATLRSQVMAQIEATTALLEKQGLEVVVAAVSELKPDADGKLQGWQVCSDTSLSIADFKAALADVRATHGSNPRLAEPQAAP